MTTAVRLAVPEDRPVLAALTDMLHEENGLYALSANKRNILLDRYFNQDGAVIGVIGDIGTPVASIYLALDQPYYSDDWSLIECWNFVHPEFRASDYAKALLGYAKDVSDQFKVPLHIGILSNKRTEAKVRLYERMLEKAGAYFIYNRRYAHGTAWDS